MPNAANKYQSLKETPMTGEELLPLLEKYSRGEMSATSLRRHMNDGTYADILMAMAAADIPMPVAPQKGREESLALAESWLFPSHG